eukprot:scaffold34.g4517.t1
MGTLEGLLWSRALPLYVLRCFVDLALALLLALRGRLAPANAASVAQKCFVALSPRRSQHATQPAGAPATAAPAAGCRRSCGSPSQLSGPLPSALPLVPPSQEATGEAPHQAGLPPGYQPSAEHLQREEFARLGSKVYADYAGAPPYSEAVLAAACHALSTRLYGNPHSEAGWGEADAAAAAAAEARRLTLAMCNARPDEYECIFTAGATAALKLVGEAFPWAGSAAGGSACSSGPGGGTSVPTSSGAGAAGASPTGGGSVFLYLRDNHTSVLGIRQLAAERSVKVVACVEVAAEAPAASPAGTGGGEGSEASGPGFALRLCTTPEAAAAVAAAAGVGGLGGPGAGASAAQHLLALPLESNFSGVRYDPRLISAAQAGRLSLLLPGGAPRAAAPCGADGAPGDVAPCGADGARGAGALPLPPGRWRVLLDAAKACGTAPPDLAAFPADFVALSFYKIFGWPTGLGALLVRREALDACLRRQYFGGGTVLAASAEEPFAVLRPGAAGWEDGTPPFLTLPSVAAGYEFIQRRGGFSAVAAHAGAVAARLAARLAALRHANGARVCVLYGARGGGAREERPEEGRAQGEEAEARGAGALVGLQQDSQWQRQPVVPAELHLALARSKGLHRSVVLRHRSRRWLADAADQQQGTDEASDSSASSARASVDGGALGWPARPADGATGSASGGGGAALAPLRTGAAALSPTSSVAGSEATAYLSPRSQAVSSAASSAAATPAALFSPSSRRQSLQQDAWPPVGPVGPAAPAPTAPAQQLAAATMVAGEEGAAAHAAGQGGGRSSQQQREQQGPFPPGVVGQGPVVAEVERLASLHGIHLRTGCLCNPGACAAALGLTPADVRSHYEAGHVCWDGKDVMGGRPTGVVRASFGYASTLADAEAIAAFVERYFVEGPARDAHATAAAAAAAGGAAHVAAAGAAPARAGPPAVPEPPMGAPAQPACAAPAPAAVVESLWIYPIKSCGGFQAEAWPLGPTGLLYDRCWMLVDPGGAALRLKACPGLAAIRPRIDLRRGLLVVECAAAARPESGAAGEALEPLEVALPPPMWLAGKGGTDGGPGALLSARVCPQAGCGERMGAAHGGEDRAVSAWFERALGVPCRLVQQVAAAAARQPSPSAGRLLVQQYQQQHEGGHQQGQQQHQQEAAEICSGSAEGQRRQRSFANDGQLLLLGSASAADLQRRVAAAGGAAAAAVAGEPLPMFLLRFRPNLVVGGPGLTPYAEDAWRTLRVGPARLVAAGGCPRCDMVCADPLTGARAGPQPLLALAGYRRSRGQIRFGVLVNQAGAGAGAQQQPSGELVPQREVAAEGKGSASAGGPEEATRQLAAWLRQRGQAWLPVLAVGQAVLA